MASTAAATMPETIKTGNVARPGDAVDENRQKVLDNSDQIPELPLACWKGHEDRVEKCHEHFRNKFNASPTFYVRVPGRVNLIGEHIDYCGYGVFPMAIEHDVLILGRTVSSPEAFSGSRAVLRLTNTGAGFEDFECNVADIRSILQNRKQGGAPNWYLYYLCGVLGTLENLGKVENDVYLTEICVDGRVPPRAGLSSSSALVCSAALATLVAYDGKLGRKEMASICARSERYIGTEGGGMDQAIAFMATAGTAQLIEFVPRLNGEKVKLPENAVFVIANSLAEANKADSSSCYNVRVAECRSATWILAKRAGIVNFTEMNTLKSLQSQLGLSLSEMLNLVLNHLHPEPYTINEIADVLEMDVNELKRTPLMMKINVDEISLKLFQRAKHVLEEAKRVYEFKNACEGNYPGGEGDGSKLVELGRLMNASHTSLRDLYECSHPRLDELVELSQPHTYGVRVTGAGWGGCIVALLDNDRVKDYLKCLEDDYYGKYFGPKSMENCVFVTQPGSGATILRGKD